jgi:hypothetical protein
MKMSRANRLKSPLPRMPIRALSYTALHCRTWMFLLRTLSSTLRREMG